MWSVEPTASGRAVGAPLRDGWLCFQRADGGERLRLARSDAPPGWETLPDEKLDLLRRVAVFVPQTGPMKRIARVERDAEDDTALDAASSRRPAGPLLTSVTASGASTLDRGNAKL